MDACSRTSNRLIGWDLFALAALVLGALFNGWDWLARDGMPGADFPGYAAQVRYVRDALLEYGRVPLWCVECYGGATNFTANLKEYLVFPLALLFDPILATKLAFLILRIAGGWGLYALVARYLSAPPAGIIAGYSFAFGAIANHQIEHLDGVLALAIMPPLIVVIVELLRRGGVGWTVALGALAACQLLNNWVDALSVPLAVVALAVFRPGMAADTNPWRDLRLASRWARRIAAALGIFLLLAGAQIAWIALDAENHRLHTADVVAEESGLWIERSPFLFVNRDNVLAPWLATHHPPGFDLVKWDGGRRYLGATWFAACAIGAFALRGARQADLRRWAAAAGISFWIEYWLSLGPRNLLWEIGTSLHWAPATGGAIRTGMFAGSVVCLLLAAARGFHAWRSPVPARWAPIRRTLIICALLGFPTVSLWSAASRILPMLQLQRSPGHFFDLAPVWLYLLFAVSLVAIERRIARPRAARAMLVVIAIATVADFAPSRRQFSLGHPIEPSRRASAMLAAMPGEGGTLRIGQLSVRYMPLASWVIDQSSLGHASGWLPWQANPHWAALINGALYIDPPRRNEPVALDATLLSAARVRYMLLLRAGRQTLREPWQLVAEGGGFALWEQPEVHPFARGYRSHVILGEATPRDQALTVSRALRANALVVSGLESHSGVDWQPRAHAIVAKDRPVPASFPSAPAPVAATARHLAPERIAIEIDAGPDPAFVSISEAHHPWWRAWIDGEPAPVLRANLALMAVRVGPGAHQIELRFVRPALVAIADGVTAAGWIALGIGASGSILGGTWRRRGHGAIRPDLPQLP